MNMTEYINEQNSRTQLGFDKDMAYKMANIVAKFIIDRYVEDNFVDAAKNRWPAHFEKEFGELYGDVRN